MSADNWEVCPRCERLFPLTPRRELVTFREDYQIGTDMETLTFFAIYTGRCGSCGYGMEFRHEAPLPDPSPIEDRA